MSSGPTIDIRGKGASYVLVVDGRPLPRRLTSHDNAMVAAHRLEERHRRELEEAIRICMCCSNPFASRHRFNRLCTICASDA